jgi:acyl-CoA reductase-like NAD-dependent aldehyde dehydrogenase
MDHARRVAKRIRADNVHINGATSAFDGCFGGYKQPGTAASGVKRASRNTSS